MAKDVKFNIKLQVDGKDVVVQASTNVKQLANDLGLVHDRVTAADKAFMKWTQSVVAIGAVTNSIQQISGVLNTLTEDSRTFGAAMKAANTMAGKDAEGFEQLKDQVAELSKSIPMARDELANGLYQVISNGVPEDNWIDYLRASSRAAVGGIADVGEVVCVSAHACVCAPECSGCRGQQRASDPTGLELQAIVSYLMKMLGTGLRALCLNH